MKMGIQEASIVTECPDRACREKLVDLLAGDLDFHDQDSRYSSHDFHPFPAKFPPQLPLQSILNLTSPGDLVLDPMMGSGTTVLEAFLTGRQGIGFDIDPLALLISKVKMTPLNTLLVAQIGDIIKSKASLEVRGSSSESQDLLRKSYDSKSFEFINYWFAPQTQKELFALLREIETIDDQAIRAFFKLAFSGTIITKSGGVSLALDLAHTRPHRAKQVFAKNGDLILAADSSDISDERDRFLTKTLRSALEEFQKRFRQNLGSLVRMHQGRLPPLIGAGNAQSLPLKNSSIDLVVTSPPYASNAIDYMRAHKFSLVWMGYSIDKLSQKRREYIGGEVVQRSGLIDLPDGAANVVAAISTKDKRKGHVLHRYYSEMARTLNEMFRVLKPGKAGVVVVGSSLMRGIDTEVANCLAEIGRAAGFETPAIGIRKLDRNRRMLPAGFNTDLSSQIQQRMHEEYIIGFYKPKA